MQFKDVLFWKEDIDNEWTLWSRITLKNWWMCQKV